MVTAQSQPKPLVLRFSAFEVNLASRELLKSGTRLKIQKQPFEILCMLLERPGQVVSREELRDRLWPENTFVEYEDSLNTAVRKLRAALLDSSDQPRYIETIARQGYRFIAPVQAISIMPGDRAERDATVANGTGELAAEVNTQSRNRVLILLAIAVSLVATAAGWAIWSRSRTVQPPLARTMLAVLPFQNLTGDAGQEYFSDGLTEEMITQLGNIDPQRLGVIARTSVMHYKNVQTPLDQIGRELGVHYVLEGSVRRDADHVRITAQLIQVKDQSHLWAKEYDRELKNLLAVQGEIAQEVADEIQLALGNHKPETTARTPISPENYDAYDLYLKGQYFFNKRTVAGFQEAVEYFQQATAKDPNLARAYAGIADSYALMAGYSMRPQTEFISKARAAALKSLVIDETLPEGHTALALIVQSYDWDWQTAEKEFRRAIELNPNYATAHHWYAEHLMWRGRFDEALQESERARQIDPLSLIIAADNGAILFFSRRYDRAIEKWRSVLELDPDFPRAHLIRAAYVEKGMFAEALADVEVERPRIDTPWYWVYLAYIYGRAGQKIQAERALNRLLDLNRRQAVDPKFIADAYAGLGDKDQTLAWLEKAYAQHSNELVTLKVNPAYDSLRGDARFENLMRGIGFSQ